MNQETTHINPDIYQNLFESGKQLLAERDMKSLLAAAVNTAVHISGAERAWINLFKEQAQNIEFQVTVNLQKTEIEAAPFEFSNMIIENVKTGGVPVMLPDSADPFFPETAKHSKPVRSLSVICIPLKHGHHAFGVLYLDRQLLKGRFTPEIFELVQEYAKFICTAVHGLKEQEQLRSLISNFEQSSGKGSSTCY
ncbi:GAF domain-containing protein [bacterium]|nr:GAF domain-containing protein [bacterium]